MTDCHHTDDNCTDGLKKCSTGNSNAPPNTECCNEIKQLSLFAKNSSESDVSLNLQDKTKKDKKEKIFIEKYI